MKLVADRFWEKVAIGDGCWDGDVKMAESYSPRWCPHVTGTFERKTDNVTGLPEPTMVEMHCTTCGDRTSVKCFFGVPRTKVATYATLHVHRDPLDAKKEPK